MAKAGNFDNKRALKRHYLIYYLRVMDRKSGTVLGHLVDVNEQGIMLMCDSPIQVGSEYSMRLRWRDNSGHLVVTDFDGACRWCHPDVNPDFFGAGFTISLTDTETVAAVRHLITELGMPN